MRRLALVAVAAVTAWACGEERGGPPEIQCSTADVPSYAEMTVWQTCNQCHSTALPEGQRDDAPMGVDFDDYATAAHYAREAQEWVYFDLMPPGDMGVPVEEKQSLYVWAQCGTPP